MSCVDEMTTLDWFTRSQQTLTSSHRGYDYIIGPVRLDEIKERIVNGMETELIGLPEVAKDVIENYPENCIEACASGYLTVKLVDEIPFALTIFDDRVGIGVCDPGTRNLYSPELGLYVSPAEDFNKVKSAPSPQRATRSRTTACTARRLLRSNARATSRTRR